MERAIWNDLVASLFT
nr:unnamed protein product [Callosobruchus chinensis]